MENTNVSGPGQGWEALEAEEMCWKQKSQQGGLEARVRRRLIGEETTKCQHSREVKKNKVQIVSIGFSKSGAICASKRAIAVR